MSEKALTPQNQTSPEAGQARGRYKDERITDEIDNALKGPAHLIDGTEVEILGYNISEEPEIEQKDEEFSPQTVADKPHHFFDYRETDNGVPKADGRSGVVTPGAFLFSQESGERREQMKQAGIDPDTLETSGLDYVLDQMQSRENQPGTDSIEQDWIFANSPEGQEAREAAQAKQAAQAAQKTAASRPQTAGHVDAELAFDYEKRLSGERHTGQEDWESYLASRPYKDKKGNVHEPGTDKFVNADKYFDSRRAEIGAEGQTAYEDMSMSDLAKKMATAEHFGDKTMENDVHEVLHAKILKQHNKTKAGVRDIQHNSNRMDNLVDRVMSVKDRELERLNEENRKPGESGPDGPEPDDPDGIHEQKTTKMQTAGGAGQTGEQATDVTEQLPVENGGEDGDGTQPRGRWASFKRGVRRHLYEAPVKQTPMGPAIEPDLPFDEWYEARLESKGIDEGPGRLDAVLDSLSEKTASGVQKAKEVISRTGEHTGNAKDFLVYAGSIAMIDAAYHSGNAYQSAHDKLEDAKDSAKEYGIDAMLLAGNAGGIAAEKTRNANLKAYYMGGLLLNRIAGVPEQVRKLLRSSSEEEKARAAFRGTLNSASDPYNVDIVSRKHNWDWDS